MFNTKNFYNITSNYTGGNSTIHEHRAPTDDSIRLAQEYMDEAFKRIISNEYVKNNNLEYRVFTFQDFYLKPKMLIIIIVNGKKYEETVDISKYIKNEIVEENTLNGSIYKLKFDESKLKELRIKILGVLLLKAMCEIDENEFSKIINHINNEQY